MTNRVMLALALVLLSAGSSTAITFTPFFVPGGGDMWGITSGPDGKIWFVDQSTNRFGSLDPQAGSDALITASIQTYPSGVDPTLDLNFIEPGPGGTLCFTVYGSIITTNLSTTQIGCFLPATPNTVTIYPVEVPTELPLIVTSIATGPDGNLWMTTWGSANFSSDFIGRLDLGTGIVTQFETTSPEDSDFYNGHDIVSAPDGNLWFTSWTTQDPLTTPVLKPVGRILPGAPNTITNLAIPIVPYYLSHLLAVGPDDRLWYTTSEGALGSFDPLAGSDPAVISSHQSYVPYIGTPSSASGLVTGPDNKVWFTNEAGYVGSADPFAGTEADIENSIKVYEQAHLVGAQTPGVLTAGADGNLWFVDRDEVVWRISDLADDSNALPVPPPPPVCPPAPTGGCRQQIVSESGSLQIINSSNNNNDKVVWTWLRGDVTPLADFNDPVYIDTYELCIYDGASSLIVDATAPPGGTCNLNNPTACWQPTPNGFLYKDPERTPDGIQRLQLRQGVDPEDAQIRLRAKGSNLVLPAASAFPLLQPITVQLLQNDGPCFESVYSAPFTENEQGPPGPSEFRDKND